MNTSITVLLILTTLFFSFGQVGRLWIPDQPIYFYSYELLLIPLVSVLVWKYRLQPFQHPKHILPVLLFFGWMLLSFFISSFSYSVWENLIGILYLLRLTAYHFLFLYLFHHFSFKQNMKWFSRTIIAVTVWIIGTSVVQYLLYPNFGNLAYLGWDPHLYRVVGLFFDPPITISVFVLLLLYYLFTIQNKAKMGYITLMLALIGLSFLTYSRGGLVALMGTVLAYILWKKQVKFLIVGACIVLVGFILLPKGSSESINLFRTTSIQARIDDYRQGIEIWQKQPVRGIGYNHIRPEKDAYITEEFVEDYNPSHAGSSFHSSFLMILVTTGVIGYALYLYMLFFFARISPFSSLSILYLSIISVFDNVLLHPFILFLFFVLISLEQQERMKVWQWRKISELYL